MNDIEDFSRDELVDIVNKSKTYSDIFRMTNTKSGGSYLAKLKKILFAYSIDYSKIERHITNQYSKKKLFNNRFGHLVVMEEVGKKGIHPIWRCKCDCGKEVDVYQTHLVQHNTTSCGCLQYKQGSSNPLWSGYGEISGDKFGSIKKGADLRHISFQVDIRYLWELFLKQDRKCALSRLPLEFGKHSKDSSCTASLDRIDNSKGYTKDNVWWVHKDINRMKNIFTLEKFRDYCRMVANSCQGGACEIGELGLAMKEVLAEKHVADKHEKQEVKK